MTTVRITKQHVLDAIKKEPLIRAGSWVGLVVNDDKHDIVVFKPESGQGYDIANTRITDPRCCVCAVGAVMRSVIDASANIESIHYAAMAAIESGDRVEPDFDETYNEVGDTEDLEELRRAETETIADQAHHEIVCGEYMSALSVYFEGQATLRADALGKDRHDLTNDDFEVVRAQVAAFVAEHFPETMEIEIDGAPPAPGVEVVALDVPNEA
jgi:hypothetical protein